VGWIRQLRALHRSASVLVLTPSNGLPWPPTARQDDRVGYETPIRLPPSAGLGVGWMLQVRPFHRCAEVSEVPRLAGLLAARAARCAGDARAVLDALAVAARPLAEDLLCAVTGLEVAVVRLGLRELAAARLLADDAAPGGGHRLRHALLAEAVAGGLLPGERADLHERTARALEAAGDAALAGEAAGHWQAPPSPDHAEALFDYANTFLRSAEGRVEASFPVLNRALAMAEAVGATALIPQILSVLAGEAFVRGQVEEGFTILQRAWNLAQAAEDGPALLWLAVRESDALLKLAKFQSAADVASRGLGAARRAGLEASFGATFLAYNAFEAHLTLGSTAQAAALVDPLTTGLPDRDHYVLHEARAEIDLLRGDVTAATRRHQRVKAIIGPVSDMLYARESACRGTEVALWAGRPGDALDEVRRVFPLFKAPDLTILCSRLLAAGMRACADLAEQARARRDAPAAEDAAAAAEELASWVERMGGVPFADHPYMATIAAERAIWEAERTRLAGPSDPRLGARRPRRGRTWAARTGPATPGGGGPKRNWTPGSPPRRRPRRCAPPWPPRTVTSRCWPKSGRSPRGPGSRSTARPPPRHRPRRAPRMG
jgi:hypothetical protein